MSASLEQTVAWLTARVEDLPPGDVLRDALTDVRQHGHRLHGLESWAERHDEAADRDVVEAHIHCPGCLCPASTNTTAVLQLWARQEHNDETVARLREVGLDAAAAVVAQLRPS